MALSESSTTETKTYTLEKYSRAYAPKKESGSSEWQHFANPVLRLILDTKRSPSKAESVRMRIVWTMNGGPASGAAQQDVVLEDLDLLAFSSIGDDKSDSSPLKGVYRETTFGLRYLHVTDSSNSPKVYRRFQVSFATPALALQLVDSIRDVCPCRLPESNIQVRKKAAAVAVPIASQVHQPPVRTTWQNTAPLPVNSIAPAPTQMHRIPTMKTPDVPAVFSSSPAPVLSSQPELLPPFSSPLRVADRAPTPSLYRPWCDPSASASQPVASMSKSLPKPASFPESSPPSSSAESTMMPPPPPPANAETLIAALREATGLYDLPHSALERLVGDVVREDKFVHLLESMSSMWAAKALLT
ncbi:hypothetical protein FB451DRAFT_1497433 [Mycena latifolia]|nr:hypothetical protein FB451DRAFT_1497433 [Mycena latifolia]